LAITVAADADRPVLAGETRQVQVNARFLYGAVASSLAVRAEVRVIADPNPFPAFKDFRWGDQQKPYPEKLIQGQASVTDGQGRAVQAFKTDDLGGSAPTPNALLTPPV